MAENNGNPFQPDAHIQDTRPSSAYDEEDLTRRLRALFKIAREDKRNRYDTWIRNYRLLNNKFGGQGSANWMPSPRDSEIYPILSSLVAWMTDQEIQVDITPASDPSSQFNSFYAQLCNDLSNVIYSTWQAEFYDMQNKLILWDTFLYGTGISKAVWDNALAGGLGNAKIKRVDPWSFYPDPNATSMDDAEYFIEARRMSLDELERRFPQHSAILELRAISGEDLDERPSLYSDTSRVPKANPGNLPGGGITRWGTRQDRTRLYDPLPGIVVYEFWLRENEAWYDDDEDRTDLSERQVDDRWRVVIMANNMVLMDEDADQLWSYASHPYQRCVFDDIGEFYGISLVDHLAYPQIYINRLLTALQQNAELVGNPVFLEGANSGLDRIGIVNKPGQRLRVQGAGGLQAGKPEWLTPPSMPQSVSDLVQFWIGRMENVSGLSALTKGGAEPKSRASEGVMNTIQEAAFVRVRAAMRNFEIMLEQATYKVADLIIDNYTEPRFMAINGPNGQQSSLALQGRHFLVPTPKGGVPLKYAIIFKAGASAPTSRQARVAEADKLFTLGVIDDEAVMEAHQYPNAQGIIARKYKKMAAGTFAPPGARQRSTKSK